MQFKKNPDIFREVEPIFFKKSFIFSNKIIKIRSQFCVIVE